MGLQCEHFFGVLRFLSIFFFQWTSIRQRRSTRHAGLFFHVRERKAGEKEDKEFVILVAEQSGKWQAEDGVEVYHPVC